MPDRIVLAAGGDVCLGRTVTEEMRRRGAGFPFGAMEEVLQAADLFTANFESPILAKGQEPPKKGLVVPEDLMAEFRLPVPAALTMANNHVFDAGESGVAFTRKQLEALGFSPFGAGATAAVGRKMRVVKVKGLRVGFLGRTEDCPQLKGRTAPGPALIKRRALLDDVRAARKSGKADVLVVHLHQGVEFVDWPAPRLVGLARGIVDAGADLVLCHHPHVPQGWERYRRRLIFYSLGNLVFDVAKHPYLREGSPWTNRSFVALIPITRAAGRAPTPGRSRGGVGAAAAEEGVTLGEPEFVPYRISELGRPVSLAGAEGDEVLEHIAEISKALADPVDLAKHWRDTCIRYLGINIDWTMGAWKAGDVDDLLGDYFARFGYDELRGVVLDLFAAAPWVKRLAREQWEDEGSRS